MLGKHNTKTIKFLCKCNCESAAARSTLTPSALCEISINSFFKLPSDFAAYLSAFPFAEGILMIETCMHAILPKTVCGDGRLPGTLD